MTAAKQRLDEWAQHSPPLAYIVECLKKVMTPEVASWIMKEGKTAEGLWAYIEKQARAQHQKGENGVLFTPPQMEECIYAYLREDEAAAPPPPAPAAIPDEPVKVKTPAKSRIATTPPLRPAQPVLPHIKTISDDEDDGSELDLLTDEEMATLDAL